VAAPRLQSCLDKHAKEGCGDQPIPHCCADCHDKCTQADIHAIMVRSAYNCLDKHVKEGRGDQTCILWEGNEPGADKALTYKEVLEETCRLVRFGY